MKRKQLLLLLCLFGMAFNAQLFACDSSPVISLETTDLEDGTYSVQIDLCVGGGGSVDGWTTSIDGGLNIIGFSPPSLTNGTHTAVGSLSGGILNYFDAIGTVADPFVSGNAFTCFVYDVIIDGDPANQILTFSGVNCSTPECPNSCSEFGVQSDTKTRQVPGPPVPLICGEQFFDSGGSTGFYQNFENLDYLICPEVPGDFVTLDFTSFNTESCCDFLNIYDSDDFTNPIVGSPFRGSTSPGTIIATNPTGCFTVLFTSDVSVTSTGWEADIICQTVAPCELVLDCSLITDEALECRTDLPPVDFDLVTAIDSCGDITKSALTIIPGNSGCPGDPVIITRQYFVNDGTNSEECMQTFTIESTIPPTIDCPADANLQCDEDTSPANTGMATGSASCGNFTVDITFADVSTQGAGCSANTYSIARTWSATDNCGRVTTCLQIISVEDDIAPVITCPTDITIECDEDTAPANTGVATAMDNCSADGDIVITSSDVSVQGTFGCAVNQYVVTRTWTATDACGNFSTCVQTINVTDSTPPALTCPADMNDLDCLTGPLPVANTVEEFLLLGGTVSDNCTNNTNGFTLEFGDSPGSRDLLDYCSANPADRTITREYRLSDNCGNVSKCTQTFTFQQSAVGPVIVEIPLDKTVSCAAEVQAELAAFNAETDCILGSTKMVEALPVIGSDNCPGARYQFRYTVEDVCGRVATHTQTYTIQNDPFEYICPNITCDIDCDATAEEAIAAFDAYTQNAIFVTSCNGLDPVVSYNFNPNSLGGCGSQTTVNFTATDPCGRSASCASTIVVVDNEAPVITGTIPNTFRNCGTFAIPDYRSWAENAEGLVDVDNNCDNTITWTYSPNTPNTENCGTGSISTTVVTFTATDNCGNASMTTAKFYLKEGPISNINLTVSGHLRTEEDVMVELVAVKAAGEEMEDDVETEEDGYYEFELPADNNYTIVPSRNDNPLNGITTKDLIGLARHVIGMELLDSPYKLIAADIDQSGTITSFDITELRKLILLIDSEFANNTSWRFVDAEYIFANPTNPFTSTFPEDYSINDLIESEIADFIAIKIGDVNGSVIPNELAARGDTRDGLEDLVFQVEDQLLRNDQVYTVDFKAKDFKKVYGYQFALSFDPNQLEMMNWNAGELNDLTVDNFGNRSHEGLLTSSWNVLEPVSLADKAVVFSVTFKAKANIDLSKAIQFNSKMATAEAYSISESLMNLALEFDSENGVGEPAFTLFQNQPNPFRDQTLIGFTLRETSFATVTIYDVAGRVLQQYKGDFSKGYNEVVVNQSDLSTTGLLYYKLETATETAIMKMIAY